MADTNPPKACPFCGGTGIYMDGPMTIDNAEHWFMCCKDCGAEGPCRKTQIHARYFWDRRA